MTYVRKLMLRLTATCSMIAEPKSLSTGDKMMLSPNTFDRTGGMSIKQSRPMPFTLLMFLRKGNTY